MSPQKATHDEEVLDLESSSQIELDRTIGSESDSIVVDSKSLERIDGPHRRRSPSEKRELLNNSFPKE